MYETLLIDIILASSKMNWKCLKITLNEYFPCIKCPNCSTACMWNFSKLHYMISKLHNLMPPLDICRSSSSSVPQWNYSNISNWLMSNSLRNSELHCHTRSGRNSGNSWSPLSKTRPATQGIPKTPPRKSEKFENSVISKLNISRRNEGNNLLQK